MSPRTMDTRSDGAKSNDSHETSPTGPTVAKMQFKFNATSEFGTRRKLLSRQLPGELVSRSATDNELLSTRFGR